MLQLFVPSALPGLIRLTRPSKDIRAQSVRTQAYAIDRQACANAFRDLLAMLVKEVSVLSVYFIDPCSSLSLVHRHRHMSLRLFGTWRVHVHP